MLIADPMERREAALTVLRDHHTTLSWQASSFMGQVAGCPDRELSEKQAAWFDKIIERAGMAPEGGAK